MNIKSYVSSSVFYEMKCSKKCIENSKNFSIWFIPFHYINLLEVTDKNKSTTKQFTIKQNEKTNIHIIFSDSTIDFRSSGVYSQIEQGKNWSERKCKN